MCVWEICFYILKINAYEKKIHIIYVCPYKNIKGLLWQSSGWDSAFQQGMQPWILVRELKSHTPHGQNTKNTKEKQYCNKFNKDYEKCPHKKIFKNDVIYYLDSKMYLSLYFNIYNDELDTTERLIWSDLIWYIL